MDSAVDLRSVAMDLGRARFIERYPHGIFVRRPTGNSEPPRPPDSMLDEEDDPGATTRFGFNTGLIEADALAVDLLDGEVVDDAGWIMLPIAKREGNPYPNRFSIGRAANCDLVIRHPSVSKLHAHVHLRDNKTYEITDYQSANGTFVNEQRLAANAVQIKVRDHVRVGVVDLQLLSASSVFALILAM